jgi:hypothetical protein
MEKNRMSIIKNPHFVDVEKTKVRFELINDSGVTSVAELTVPPKMARGVNAMWDRILDEFDVEKMRRERNELETRRRRQQEFDRKKRLAAEENNKLKILFDAKMKAFEMPFIANAEDKIKTAIRRAPDMLMLNIIIHHQMMNYMSEKNMSFIDVFDELDDIQDAKEAQQKAQQSKS